MDSELLIKNINDHTIVDVRSPSEYLKGHIPNSLNIPLFSDEERKIIGTIYKQVGKKEAIEKGLEFVKMLSIVNQFKPLLKKPVAIYCARGGMRSFSVSWLLNLFGCNVQTLKGGYKFFRRWVLEQFKKKYQLKIIGGYTGVGKTEVIQSLESSIDLEALASHKGSVFGGFEKKQPTQEHFENLLALELFSRGKDLIFLEDESRFIGTVLIPNDFYKQMKAADVIVLQDLLEKRVARCVFQYKNYEKADLKGAVKKIEKRMGFVAAKQVIDLIDEEKYETACGLLFSYYDKLYGFSLSKRDPRAVSYLEISHMTNEEISAFFQKALS